MIGVLLPRGPHDVKVYSDYNLYELTERVAIVYQTPGPKFVVEKTVATYNGLTARECNQVRDDLIYDLFAEVKEYNRIVRPVPNGPADRVWLAECLSRMAEAESFFDTTELMHAYRHFQFEMTKGVPA